MLSMMLKNMMPDVWQRIVQGIYQGTDIAVIGLLENKYRGAGCCLDVEMDNYIRNMSYATTSISSFIFRQSYYEEIEDKLKFGDTCLNQVYLQLEILSKHKNFMLVYGHIWSYQTGYAAYERQVPLNQRGNYLKVFVQEYFDILESFRMKGLSFSTIKFDKHSVLFKLILPRCETLAYRDNVWCLADDTLEIYAKYYRDEDYYLHGKDKLEYYIRQQSILQG